MRKAKHCAECKYFRLYENEVNGECIRLNYKVSRKQLACSCGWARDEKLGGNVDEQNK